MERDSIPLSVHYQITCLKYCLKLLQMPNTRYPKACYLMLKNLDDINIFSWVTYVRYMLKTWIKGFLYISAFNIAVDLCYNND